MRKAKNTNIANVGRNTSTMHRNMGSIRHKPKKGPGSYSRKNVKKFEV